MPKITVGRKWSAKDYREQRDSVAYYARELLRRIDTMTSDEFERGGERVEREDLRTILNTLPKD